MSLLTRAKKLFTQQSGGKAGKKQLDEVTLLRERVELLEALLQKKEQAVEMAKTNFLRNLYHEIRTPLNAIIGFSDIIEANSISTDEKESYIHYIRESSRDFLKKMDNIVEASLIQAGMLKIKKEACILYDVMEEIYSYFSMHKHIVERNIAFLLNVPENLHKIQFMCDSYRVTQILTNLLSNAFKFTTSGVIEFGFHIVDKNLEFFVRDTGIGGLEGKEDELFRNFSKLNDPDLPYEGLGLGLSLSKNILDEMDGKIWCVPNKGKRGTSFYFTIPYQPVYITKRSKSTDRKRTLAMVNVLKRSVVV